jgi:hypothetical protein
MTVLENFSLDGSGMTGDRWAHNENNECLVSAKEHMKEMIYDNIWRLCHMKSHQGIFFMLANFQNGS